MSAITTERVAWHRAAGPDYVGAVALGDGFVRLVGRHPDSSLEVSLSIPLSEIEAVHAIDGADGRGVVLELSGAQSISLRTIDGGADGSPALAERIRSAASSRP